MKSSNRWSCLKSPRYPLFSKKVRMPSSMFSKPLVRDADGIVESLAEDEPPDDKVQTHFRISPAVMPRVPGSRVVRVRVAVVKCTKRS